MSFPSLSPLTSKLLQTKYVMAHRQDWCVLKASGAGIRDYLQGQITQDMSKLIDAKSIHACLLTPKGKAVSELYLLEGDNNEIILLTPMEYAVSTIARLRQFALGYTLRIGVVDTWGILDIQGKYAADGLKHVDLPEPEKERLATSHVGDMHVLTMAKDTGHFWIIGNQSKLNALLVSSDSARITDDQLEAIRIIRGIPHFGVDWNEKIYPMNANLLEFNGVSFDKGCYVGQEVTSRMHWRNSVKKKFYRVRLENAPTVPCPILTTAKIGMLTSVAMDAENACVGIAHLPVNVAELDTPLSLENGATVSIIEVCHP